VNEAVFSFVKPDTDAALTAVRQINEIPSRAALLKRCTPRESVEPGVVPIRGDPFTPEFNRECREPGVLDGVSGGSRLLADGLEYPPVAVPWNDDGSVGLFQQDATESENIIQ
jgi:hypothetical protein